MANRAHGAELRCDAVHRSGVRAAHSRAGKCALAACSIEEHARLQWCMGQLPVYGPLIGSCHESCVNATWRQCCQAASRRPW
jgi:hypothetical protein